MDIINMDIHAKNGSKVVFYHPANGYTHHQETAAKHLEVGQEYTVDYTDVGGYHTDVFLIEVPGVAFNSVMFDDKGD